MGGGVGCRSGHNTQEAAEELRDLAGDATYRQLLERHPDVTNSLGALGCRGNWFNRLHVAGH